MNSKKDLITRAGNTLYEKLSSCEICPRGCGVNRLEGQEVFAGPAANPRSLAMSHILVKRRAWLGALSKGA
ncbi:hypothetical protein ES703_86536 [subsurface metagenome]